MALVICCVFLTERMRRRMSMRLGMCRYRGRGALWAGHKAVSKLLDDILQLFAQGVVQNFPGPDFLPQPAVRVVHEPVEFLLELPALVQRQIVQVTVGSGEDNRNLLFHRQRLVLALLENLHHVPAAVELRQRGLVQIGAELREGRQLAVLRQVQAQAARNLLHGLDLGVAAHAAHGDAHVDGRPYVGVEQIGFQVNLPVSDGNDIGGDVGGNVAGLGFDERQRGQRTAAVFVVQLGGALQQPAVQVEHVAGVGLAPRRAAQQERDFTIGSGVLGKVVVDAQGVPAAVAEILAYGAAREGRDVLHGGRVRGRRAHHDAVFHGAVIFQRLHHLGHGGALLPDGHVDANYVAALLVDDGVEGDGGLAGLAIADDQLALAAPDGNHGVDGLDAGLHGLFHRPPRHHARRLALDGVELGGEDGAFVVDGPAQRVHHAPDQRLPDRDRHDAARAAHFVAFLDFRVVAQQHRADLVFLQVHGYTGHVVREFDQFARHDLFQAMDSGDAVAHGDHRADLRNVDGPLVVFNLLAENTGDFVRSNLSHNSFRLAFGAQAASQRRQLPAHRTVVNRGTDPRHYAADQPLIHCKPHAKTPARQALEHGGQRGALRLGHFARRGDFRAGEAQALIHDQLEAVENAGKRGDAAVIDENVEKIPRDARELQDLRDASHHRPFAAGRHRRRRLHPRVRWRIWWLRR